MSDTAKPPKRRHWRKDERVKVSILQIFRAAAQERRETRRTADRTENHTIKRRHSINEQQLRAHLQAELAALLNTIRLDAVVPLDDTPHMAASVLNYGFRDLSGMGAAELESQEIVESIRQSLIDHEPRLIPSSIDVKVLKADAHRNQRLSVAVYADFMGDPVDIPVDFNAEVDLGSGRLNMQTLTVRM
ncbi:MAG: type VI secretion system baseplate subunit TssE [Loktanella sp.]|nr:type VI secretion system baseplate subunit TssE [Loktanella sp.]